jgi:hypothetical protein
LAASNWGGGYPVSLEEALSRWFPTAMSKIVLAAGMIVLAALIMPS